ncbi:hypothetical protein F5B22DRAFT_304853 [Xylaria bambusicola]|uniref:uncharacterized protein n=1 Tax=Xylaria bambusicola TaxID=326684 RepID=UPI0020082EE3|nr:uncharacterized protein F5B22DRAFT_304853 [Xylaria bambusicola]KAI0512489.1 hypothetical protein F5B22DRAFT_304853 [Xylaria bambusicola]
MKLSPPPDPRNLLPSRAHPEQRKHRKQLEKQHPFGFTEIATLGLIGLTLAWDIDKQVQKCAEKKGKEHDERDRHQRDKAYHDRTPEPRRDHRGSESGQSSRRGDWGAPERCAYDPRRRQSAGYRDDARRDDEYRGYRPRYDPRDDYRCERQYEDPRGSDSASRRRIRRDSW